MSKKMVIDAQHSEETRVAIVDKNNTLKEYDLESNTKETNKGNIYLAKVVRVEPSLQAAFIEYGGNRHGFLAFTEIHPDYFRIPVSDREVLKAKLGASNEEDAEDLLDGEDDNVDETANGTPAADDENGEVESVQYDVKVDTISQDSAENDDDDVRQVKRPHLHKMYKIQEVIHKNQILLVQVVKEERGQKGAALTTFLSLPGRYCVLMPNSPRAGGISRKISSAQDRKRLRDILKSLEVPQEMGLIIRTAGQVRTKSELKRDADYLKRLWNEIREDTLVSTAPTMIYQEDNIIKRAIRDHYNKDIDEIVISGEESYKSARNFMKKLLPSHVKRIKAYKDEHASICIKYKIEQQIEAMHDPEVLLPSGGSIVINPTEALTAIDINSGKATKERHIQETALKTNLEAAIVIADQVKLRDLGGLIVVDFIDMDERRHTNQVERRIREAFRDDRARVQMGKISPFGLLELSRQRLRPSVSETSSTPCVTCNGTGHVRSRESLSLQVLRTIEEEGLSQRSHRLRVECAPHVAFYLLNDKRGHIRDLEKRFDIMVEVVGNDDIVTATFRLLQLEMRKVDKAPSTEAEGERQSHAPQAHKKNTKPSRRGGPKKAKGPDNQGKDTEHDAAQTERDGGKNTRKNAQDNPQDSEKPKKRSQKNPRRGNKPQANGKQKKNESATAAKPNADGGATEGTPGAKDKNSGPGEDTNGAANSASQGKMTPSKKKQPRKKTSGSGDQKAKQEPKEKTEAKNSTREDQGTGSQASFSANAEDKSPPAPSSNASTTQQEADGEKKKQIDSAPPHSDRPHKERKVQDAAVGAKKKRSWLKRLLD